MTGGNGSWRPVRRSWALLAAGLVATAGLTVPSTAAADTAPLTGTAASPPRAALPSVTGRRWVQGAPPPATVSTDPLPTWQVDGVVWSQVLVGETVYATGSFTRARPPGVAPGGAGEIPALNLFAYDITTGDRVATFSHALNGQGRVITASPDGSRVYVGGDFTTVDGVAAGHVAAFSTSTGALDRSFRVTVSSTVRSMAASASTLYLGGSFGTVNGGGRKGLAAVKAVGGTLLPWAPRTDSGAVLAMVLAPDQSRLIVGGSFQTLNGAYAYGMGSLSASTGAVLPWAANRTIRSAGSAAGITSLRTDGTLVYGSGYQFLPTGGGNFEGTFGADPLTGAITVVNDCHGDTYDVLPVGPVLYSVGHAHDCRWVGSFPDTSPRVRWQRALAQTTAATRTNTGPDAYGWDYSGQPASTVLHWFPQMPPGTFTGQQQAAWSLTGNASYIAMGGEFPSVNGTPQQGLVRMAVTSLVTDLQGPTYSVKPSRPVPQTTATTVAPGSVQVDFGTAWDTDNKTLTYDVLRDDTTWVHSRRVKTSFWSLPTQSFTDTGLTPGASHHYRVRITDPFGNTLWSPRSSTVTA
ncbi:MAG: hypothetical protein AVDCRST_MAG16-2026 [uncultured Frankineae bacterium]|uniref:Fibronectin type-III domain-containing protein n=1 Tax=uncultured Frankineae bacterium TaxID=437475 RepID=A0A6J4M3S7_9ACTN|nr:MAG: hypothetical protein AVDCRST_MAG16-2026 [uncultured Frankineae bacterium]